MIWQFMAIELFEVNHDQLSGLRGLGPKQSLPSPVATFVMSGSADVMPRQQQSPSGIEDFLVNLWDVILEFPLCVL